MLKRILSALIALPLFFAVVFLAPDWVLTIAICLLSALACYEMLHATGLCKSTALLVCVLVCACGLIVLLLYSGLSPALGVLLCGIVVLS